MYDNHSKPMQIKGKLYVVEDVTNMPIFENKYNKLLRDIKNAQVNGRSISLPNGINLDFTPGRDYDSCAIFFPGHPNNRQLMQQYINKIEQVVTIAVDDNFCGDVLIRAVGFDRMLVDVLDVTACYDCQKAPKPGDRYWIGYEEICPDVVPRTEFSESDLPF
jgi:hypothetical protein